MPVSTTIRCSSGGAGTSDCAKTRRSADINLLGRNAPYSVVPDVVCDPQNLPV